MDACLVFKGFVGCLFNAILIIVGFFLRSTAPFVVVEKVEFFLRRLLGFRKVNGGRYSGLSGSSIFLFRICFLVYCFRYNLIVTESAGRSLVCFVLSPNGHLACYFQLPPFLLLSLSLPFELLLFLDIFELLQVFTPFLIFADEHLHVRL